MTWIVRYGEIALKGKNRHRFEQQLVQNIKACLDRHHVQVTSISRPHGRVLVDTQEDCSALQRVFGIISISPARTCDATIDAIKVVIEEFLPRINRSFRITTQRVDKSMNLRSSDVDREIGAFVQERTGQPVNLKHFDYELGIELIAGKAFVFDSRIRGFGGLPVGIEGEAYALIDDDQSLLAAWLAMKRGCRVHLIGDYDVRWLDKYSPRPLQVSKSTTVIDKPLVVKDTLATFTEYALSGLILRPLIGYTEKEIKEKIEALS